MTQFIFNFFLRIHLFTRFPRFQVFHEMVNAGVEPNVHTYGALIDGCAKAGQIAKAFGAYGILRSKVDNMIGFNYCFYL